MSAFVNTKILVCALAAVAVNAGVVYGGIHDTAKVPAERGIAAQELAAFQTAQSAEVARQSRTLSAALVE